MRVEPHEVGSVLHIIKRGARGLPIVKDAADRKNFVQSLCYLNTEHQDHNWRETLKRTKFYEWPESWPKRKPLTDIWAWTLMPNHFHMILHENQEGGIARFMQRLCGSMSVYANKKYGEKGSLFQGGYKARVVHDDADLRWLASYVMVKNTLELYPGGLIKARNEFKKAWEWALRYPFSSIGAYGGTILSPLITREENMLYELFKDPTHFKVDSQDMLEGYLEKRNDGEQMTLTLEE